MCVCVCVCVPTEEAICIYTVYNTRQFNYSPIYTIHQIALFQIMSFQTIFEEGFAKPLPSPTTNLGLRPRFGIF